jgi:hypothetical protein
VEPSTFEEPVDGELVVVVVDDDVVAADQQKLDFGLQ